MTVRERLLGAGYKEEEIDRMAEEEYNRIVEFLPKKKRFIDTKVGRFLSTDWSEYLYNKFVLYLYEKQIEKERKSQLQECKIDRNNPYEVYKYNASHNIMPIKTTDHGNGNYTHEYEDGTIVNVHTTLSSIFPDNVDFDKFLEDVKIQKKELLADYLNIPAEEILAMSEDEIDELVRQNEKRKNKNRRRVRTNN